MLYAPRVGWRISPSPAAQRPNLRAMALFYVNLAHRTDRRGRAERLWRERFRMRSVTRVPGVVDEPAYRGCTRAHLAAIGLILETPVHVSHVVLAEDDLILLPGKTAAEVMELVGTALACFPRLNLLFLTATLKHFKRTPVPGIVKLKRRGAKAMAGTVILRDYPPVLRHIDVNALKRKLPHDKLTRYVQGRHSWYLRWPHLMHQAEDYSDIDKRHVGYEYLGEDGQMTRPSAAAD